jgi:hypothetical protein
VESVTGPQSCLFGSRERISRDEIASGSAWSWIRTRRSGARASGSRVSRSERRSPSVTDHRPKGQPTLPVPEQTVYPRSARVPAHDFGAVDVHGYADHGDALGRARRDRRAGRSEARGCDPCLSNPRTLGPPPW